MSIKPVWSPAGMVTDPSALLTVPISVAPVRVPAVWVKKTSADSPDCTLPNMTVRRFEGGIVGSVS
jgi:hypothetical protein